jgi:hypothetical protein
MYFVLDQWFSVVCDSRTVETVLGFPRSSTLSVSHCTVKYNDPITNTPNMFLYNAVKLALQQGQ